MAGKKLKRKKIKVKKVKIKSKKNKNNQNIINDLLAKTQKTAISIKKELDRESKGTTKKIKKLLGDLKKVPDTELEDVYTKILSEGNKFIKSSNKALVGLGKNVRELSDKINNLTNEKRKTRRH